ncbi:reverse transcriptase domain-containing protein [Tanacetum coccineum]|uniref:Reverse transcriptase domain-containing protein n=1 Tax=Tanacetum coccineum TaxID=301880 RepID=A0ABQ5HI07_9ASTR
MLSNIEDIPGPNNAMQNPSQPLKFRKTLFQNSQRFTHFYQPSHSELVDIEKVALSSSLRSLKSKCTIESRAKKRSSINLIRTLMEILLEPTSNKLMVGDLCDSLRIKLVTTGKKRWCDSIRIKLVPAGNPVKEILLKLNLPDHRKLKDGGEVKEFQRSFCHSDTERLSRSDEVLKLKNFKKDATLKLFKSTNQERLKKENEEAQQRKFLENLKQLHINIPFTKALSQMPKYAKFLKGLLSNKTRLEEACTVTLNERCSTVLLNTLPSKEKDPEIFTIPCDIGHLHINNSLADLGASISLMPYTMYEKLGLDEPKPIRMSLELADRPPAEDDKCSGIDYLDTTIHSKTQELLEDDQLDSFLVNNLEKSIDQSDLESCGMANDGSESKIPIRRIEQVNTLYSESQETKGPDKTQYDHLYSASANEINEKKTRTKRPSFPLRIRVLEKCKGEIACKMSYIKEISLSFYTQKILMEESFKPVIQPQRRLNPKVQDVVKNEIVRLLYSGLIYPISDGSWVSLIHVILKKGGMAVVLNDNNELIPSRTVTGWRVCIDCRKLNDATRKYHFLLPFIDKMLEHLSGNEYYCFLDGFSGFFQIPIAPEDQEKTTFTCPYETFAYRRMLFGLCNALTTFQRCMMAIFHDMEKCHFMVKEGIVLGHKIFGKGIEVDKVKIDVIVKLPYPTNVKDVGRFNIKIKDKKGAENLAADHLSRLENPNMRELAKEETADKFLDEHLMILKSKLNDEEPWYADYVNYIVGKVVSRKWTPKRRKWFFSQVRNYFWDEPYAFRLCPDNVMRRCVAEDKILEILAHFHSGLTRDIIVPWLEKSILILDRFLRLSKVKLPWINPK